MNIISLFSGAGGLDLGFKNAGFNILWANEYDKNIWETHKLNFPETFLNQESITKIDEKKIPNCLGIIGGPPCQAFSEAGAKKGTTDPRGQLFWDYIRILNEKKPMFFVAENVSGLLAERHKKDLNSFINAFDSAGYNVSSKLYIASNYGVPQDRERLIFIGYRKDLSTNFGGLITHNNKVTLREAIGNIPLAIATKSGRTDKSISLNANEYMTGGFSSMFMSRNRVREWDEQSFTILATARQIPLHPQAPKMKKIDTDKFIFNGDENLYRRLSVRECARIQTFPDSHKFIYNRIEDGYRMVGNAVPVKLAEQIAKQIKADLFN